MSIAVISCYFNPCDYRLVREKYKRFRECLGRCDYFCAEVAWSGPWQTDSRICIRGLEAQILWQKERLLNLLIEQLPDRYDRVVWVDADMIFLDHNWLQAVDQMLDEYPVGQPWSRFHLLDASGRISRSIHSACYKRHHPEMADYACPGGCWAARREVLAKGLIDWNVVGGGDTMQLAAWTGVVDQDWMLRFMNPEWRAVFNEEAKRAHPSVQGQLGCCEGEMCHLYHGTRKNRRYVERVKYLTDYCFDPRKHLQIAENGLWSWTEMAHPEMVARVRDYFSERLEDE